MGEMNMTKLKCLKFSNNILFKKINNTFLNRGGRFVENINNWKSISKTENIVKCLVTRSTTNLKYKIDLIFIVLFLWRTVFIQLKLTHKQWYRFSLPKILQK